MTFACRAADRVLNEPLKTDRGTVGKARTDVLPAVWDESARELARLVGALGISSDRAEDVLQDVFVAALEKAPATADRTELRRWLFRVTINRCNLEHRRGTRWQRVWQAIRQLGRGAPGS
jgi:DNA-directed RNA polymerase specialized sigma24 family protein